MTVAELIALLQDTGDYDVEVFLCPNVMSVDAVEQCPGDLAYGLAPYITLHSACRYPADHGKDTIPEFGGYCYNHSSYYCGCIRLASA